MRLVLSFFLFPLLLAGADLSTSLEKAVEPLGAPIRSVVIADAAYGYGPEGEPRMYVTIKGDPAVLNVIDVLSGERVSSFELNEALISWGMDAAPDGSVYIGSQRGGRLYRHVPGTDEVENLGRVLAGESHIWQIDHDPQGRIYGGTFPGGRLFQYDPATGRVRDYGRLAEDSDYVRGVAVGDGVVYAGLGARQARIIEVNIESGERREIALPPAAENATFAYLLRFARGKLFAWLYDAGSFVYDTESGEWVGKAPLASQPGPDGRSYFIRDGEVHAYDLQSGDHELVGFSTPLIGPRSWGWLDLGHPDFPGKSLVTTDQRGAYLIFNPATGQGRHLQADAEGQTQEIRSMHRGPDGRIYIGGYLSPGMMAAYDPVERRTVPLYGVAQVENFGSHGGEVYVGVYSRAIILRYDPAEPWNFGENPRAVTQLSPYEQDRPFAFASAGEMVAIGTVPVTGRLGGALTLYHPAADVYQVFRDILPGQSVVSLVYHEPSGLLVGGTSISGGLGIEPTATEGRLFLWDLEREEIVWSITPVAGEMAVTGLILDPNGLVWGASGQHLFTFNPETREMIRVIDLYPDHATVRPRTVWMNGHLSFHTDGLLYGRVRGRIFRLNPADWHPEILIEEANYFAQADDGDIYFSRGHYLFRLPFDAVREAR